MLIKGYNPHFKKFTKLTCLYVTIYNGYTSS